MVNTAELIILSEAARMVGVSGMWMRHLADTGALPVQRLANGTRLFRRKHIEAFMRRRAARPPVRGRPPSKKLTKRTTKPKEKRSTQ